MAKKKAGRPAGRRNHVVAHATAQVTRCPKCGSTERLPYWLKREKAIAGVDAAGQPFTHVVWRRTRCADCGQVRDDRHVENRRH